MHVMFQLVIKQTRRFLGFLIVTAAFYLILCVVSINAYISKRGRSAAPDRNKLPVPIDTSALKTLAVTVVATPDFSNPRERKASQTCIVPNKRLIGLQAASIGEFQDEAQ